MKRYLIPSLICIFLVASLPGNAGEGSHVGNGAPTAKTIAKVSVEADLAIDMAAKTATVTAKSGKLPAFAELTLKTATGAKHEVALSADNAAAPTKFSGKLPAGVDKFSAYELRLSADKKEWTKFEKNL